MRYAQIDTNSICVAVSDLKGEITASNMVPIADDANPLGKKWENDMWNDVAAPLPFTATSAPLMTRRVQKLLKQGKTNAALQLINKE
jgi:hypothetical protein